ncbi:hypothetical protein P7H33_02930 [Vagococcus lutrae]|uniref:hypothetical protein n=1 Tax=Vagococcus lutrae TaxID=81947 RepID=UPI00288E701B|nr:hypothetical protein [Vagococcus lutrae]MDT2811896.1 hypothetical protein [Vagococcus lutrae]
MANRMKVIFSLFLITLYFQSTLKIVAINNDLKIETTKTSESNVVESDIEADTNETHENNTENVPTIQSENTLGTVEKISEENVSPALTNSKTNAIQMVATWGILSRRLEMKKLESLN